MKRLCTEEEKQLLYQNRQQMLKGVFHTTSKSKSAPLIISVFISCILAVLLGAMLEEKHGVNARAADIGMKVVALALVIPLKI